LVFCLSDKVLIGGRDSSELFWCDFYFSGIWPRRCRISN